MLKIAPEKFKVLKLDVRPLADTDTVREKRKLDLEVDVYKLTSQTVSIQISVKVLIAENVHLSTLYEVVFTVAESEDEDFEVSNETLQNTFLQVNAPAIAYPFLRAFIATVSVNCGYDSVILPAVNFQALYNKKKEKGEVASSKILA